MSQVGGIVFGGGVTIGAGWGIMAAQTASTVLWDWPMWLAAALVAVGSTMLVWSFFVRNESESSSGRLQSQEGGARSVNIQAGRDVTYNNTRDQP
jgi:NO-binding membrane sensor protein with MHYT domain